MKKYEVLCLSSYYTIKADGWIVGAEGLKFYQDEEVVAWFITWDHWRIVDET
jgi:hypothetical protein